MAVTSARFGGVATLYFGDGHGRLTTPATGQAQVVTGSAPSNVYLADVDSDGDLDMLFTNRNETSLSVRLQGAYTGSVLLPVRPAAALTAATPRLVAYPNPAHGMVRVEGAGGAAIFVLIDLLGRERYRQPVRATLDVSGVAPGLYLLRCGTRTTRLVVE